MRSKLPPFKKKGFEPLGVSFPGRSDLGSLWWVYFPLKLAQEEKDEGDTHG